MRTAESTACSESMDVPSVHLHIRSVHKSEAFFVAKILLQFVCCEWEEQDEDESGEEDLNHGIV